MSSDPPWKNPGISLGTRCVILARHEMRRGVKSAPYGQPNTSPDVERYLAPCVRDLDGNGTLDPLRLTVGNWCMAFQSWLMTQCLAEGEYPPHEYRAGVVEAVADAKTRGLWHDVREVREGDWTPAPGDLVIWDRTTPGKPETAWMRHVNRLVRLSATELLTIGGNEHRTILEREYDHAGLASPKLLGFVSYFQAPVATELSDTEREENLRLTSAFVANALRSRAA